jgi:hypothetical protein
MIGSDNDKRGPDPAPRHPGPGHFSARQCGKCGQRKLFTRGWKKHPVWGVICCGEKK